MSQSGVECIPCYGFLLLGSTLAVTKYEPKTHLTRGLVTETAKEGEPILTPLQSSARFPWRT